MSEHSAEHDDPNASDDRGQTRADLLPEELAVGSDDPRRQAEALLADSDERTAGVPDDEIEHRGSGDTV